MLLPSAMRCDSNYSTQTRTRYQSALFASPPLSPPAQSLPSSALNNIYSSCRVLQSMLTPTQLPSPPTRHSTPPFKLRLRQRKSLEEAAPIANTTAPQRKKITKRAPVAAAPRGLNKRRRSSDDDLSRDDEYLSEEILVDSAIDDSRSPPTTPKRARIAPEHIPLGLERSDFHSLHLQQVEHESEPIEEVFESVENDDEGEWSTEEDRILVELVLEKLKLSKSEWQDCARSLGKDRGSVGKRWKSLMGAGEVGLKRQRRRIHGTWR